MTVDVMDLTSPPAAPPRRRGRSASVIDLVSPSPPAAPRGAPILIPDVVCVLSDEEERPAAKAAARAAASPARRRSPAPKAPAAHPPRLLAEAGKAADLARRGALPLGPSGEPLCRWCKTPVTPPRKTFCSASCVHQHRLRSDPAYARQATFERDCGRCACCGLAAHLLYCGAAAAAALGGPRGVLPAARRSSLRHWAPTAVLKSLLKAASAAGGEAAWRASVKGRAKPRPQLLAEVLDASLAVAGRHTWPPAVLLAISAGDVSAQDDGGDDGTDGEAACSDDDDADAAETRGAREAAAAAAPLLARWLNANGFHSAVRAPQLRAGLFWQMDHRLPVAEGGGSCGAMRRLLV
jgi:hypothetical protein